MSCLCPVIDHVSTTIQMNTDFGQPYATLDWARPDLAEHLDMYNLTADFYQGFKFPIGVTNLTHIATGPCGKNITFLYDVIVMGKHMVEFCSCIQVCISVHFDINPIFNEKHLQEILCISSKSSIQYILYIECCLFCINADEENPTYTEQQTDNISLEVSCNTLKVAVNWTAPIVTDNSGYLTLSSDYIPGDLFPVDETTMVTYSATDPSGNIATRSFFVTLFGK